MVVHTKPLVMYGIPDAMEMLTYVGLLIYTLVNFVQLQSNLPQYHPFSLVQWFQDQMDLKTDHIVLHINLSGLEWMPLQAHDLHHIIEHPNNECDLYMFRNIQSEALIRF